MEASSQNILAVDGQSANSEAYCRTKVAGSTGDAMLQNSLPDDFETLIELDRDQNCDRRRPAEEQGKSGSQAETKVTIKSSLLGKTITPILKERIPGVYGPADKNVNGEMANVKPDRYNNPHTKYCYRHRPDSKCRKAADEKKMDMIQNKLERLPTPDQQAIVNVWSLFSAAPARQRELMLQGIITQCCFPQLSSVAREVHEQLKIDFLSIFPIEISQKILCFLDTVSLCRASQVSRRWRILADSDAVWAHMCQQHIDRKCTKCGWGLPKLLQKRLRDSTRQRRLAKIHRLAEEAGSSNVTTSTATLRASSSAKGLGKRDCETMVESSCPKRQCVGQTQDKAAQEKKLRPWKLVYRDRWNVGYNWRQGRCTIRNLSGGHTNGVTCLKLDETGQYLVSGSYDNNIVIWDVGTGELIRTLRGHTGALRALQVDENKIISASLDGTLRIWNWNGDCLNELRGHSKGVLSLHCDGDLLASGSKDMSIKIFNFKTKTTLCLKEHTDWVNCVVIDERSRTVLSASDDTTIKLWCLDSRRCIKTMRGHIGHVQQVVTLWDYEPDDAWTQAVENADAASTGSASANTDGQNGTPRSTSPKSPLAPEETEHLLRQAYGSAFTENPSRPLPPRYVISAGLDSTIMLWETATGQCIKTFFGHLEGIWGLACDTLRVVSGGNDGLLKLWDHRTGKCERTFAGHRGPVTCVGLSESMLISGGEDGEVRIYSFKSSTGQICEAYA